LVMELVTGSSLEILLSPGVPMDVGRACTILRQIAAALDYAHNRGVIHRDIKPGNILVCSNDDVKITDFGIARICSQTITQAGLVLGTLSYMAPEQLRGAKVDGKADQFSLAVLAYQILSGEQPFTA